MKLLFYIISILFASVPAVAAGTNWRPIYDKAMLWVNFIILVSIIVKFGKGPLVNFFKGQKKKMEQELSELKQKKEDALKKVQDTEKELQQSGEHYEKLKNLILSKGEKRKNEIIEDAQAESNIMLKNAKHKLEFYLLNEKNRFKGELIDSAVDIAVKKLKKEVTLQDNKKILDSYIKSIA